MVLIRAILVVFCLKSVTAWDSEQLEVFDVVDEVKENFYTLLNVSQVSVKYFLSHISQCLKSMALNI
jgi:hypothetical protein